jgi:hypothetical protein
MAGTRSSGNLRRFTFINNVEEESLIKAYRFINTRQNQMGQFEATFDLVLHKLSCRLMAEAVEKVPGVRNFETMIQEPGRY